MAALPCIPDLVDERVFPAIRPPRRPWLDDLRARAPAAAVRMNGKRWPIALAVLSVLILGSYLFVTERMVREIRASTELHMRMYAIVNEVLLFPGDDAGPPAPADAAGPVAPGDDAWLLALAGLQREFTRLSLPVVVLNPEGDVVAAANLPFEFTGDSRDWPRVVEYAARLDRANPAGPVVTSYGSIHFGEPPVLRWLRWVPWLQVLGAALVLVLAVGSLRVNLRAERERMWAAMARELAHQMGTPLSSLSGWVELLGLPADEQAQLASAEHIASHIGADVERLERVARRFELIGKAPALTGVPVESIVTELQSYLRPRLPRLGAGVEFQSRIVSGPGTIRGNAVLLVWALENLVKNALDALAGRGGRIRLVAFVPEPGWVCFRVSDNGPGIAPQVRSRIFEPGVTTKPSGWGVGLALTRRIVEDYHGGRISVRSRRGGGTIFEVRVPADTPVVARSARRALGYSPA